SFRRQSSRGAHFQSGSVSQFAEFRQASLLASDQHQHQHVGRWRAILIRRYSVKNNNATRRTRRLRAALQQDPSLTIRPISQDALEEINIRSSWQRIEETLTHGRHAVAHAGILKYLARAGDRPRQVNQHTLYVWMGTKHLRKQRSCTTTDVHYGAHILPISV